MLRWVPMADKPAGDDDASQSPEDLFRVERWHDAPDGEEPACADCGRIRDLIGPVSFDGELIENGDMVCPGCAKSRGLDVTHCTCGTSSPRDLTCPGCNDYLGGAC